MNNYYAQFLRTDSDPKKSTFIFYKGQFYRHLPNECRKDKNLYTFIKQDGSDRGYHELWSDVHAANLFLVEDTYKTQQIDEDVELDAHIERLRNINKDKKVSNNINSDGWFSHGNYIIGPISSEANWVKEKMTFSINDFIPDVLFEYNEESDDSEIIGWKMEIKCSNCKHFH